MGESCPILSTDVVLQPFLKLEEQPALMKGADLDAFMYRLKVLRCPKAGPPRSVCLVHRAVYIYREEVKKQCAHRLIGHWWHPARHPASTYLYVYLPYRVSRLWISNASLASQPCDPGHGLHHLDGALDRDPWPVGGELGPKLYICERIELIFGNYMRMCMTCKMLLYIPYIYIYIYSYHRWTFFVYNWPRPGVQCWIVFLQEFDCVEFYAGKGNLTRMMRLSGLRAAKLDFLFGSQVGVTKRKHQSNPMDLLSDSGFASLGLTTVYKTENPKEFNFWTLNMYMWGSQ